MGNQVAFFLSTFAVTQLFSCSFLPNAKVREVVEFSAILDFCGWESYIDDRELQLRHELRNVASNDCYIFKSKSQIQPKSLRDTPCNKSAET